MKIEFTEDIPVTFTVESDKYELTDIEKFLIKYALKNIIKEIFKTWDEEFIKEIRDYSEQKVLSVKVANNK